MKPSDDQVLAALRSACRDLLGLKWAGEYYRDNYLAGGDRAAGSGALTRSVAAHAGIDVVAARRSLNRLESAGKVISNRKRHITSHSLRWFPICLQAELADEAARCETNKQERSI